MSKKEVSIFAGLVIAIIFSLIASANYEANLLRQNTLRLHIIAQDDSKESVLIKMAVADAVKTEYARFCKNAENYNQALDLTQQNLDYIKKIADAELSRQNAGYDATCDIENFYFETTEYLGKAIPRGDYTALIIRLGAAQGKNWWCVMYPEIAAGIGDVEENGTDCLWENERVKIKLKAVEVWQGVKHMFDRLEKYDRI